MNEIPSNPAPATWASLNLNEKVLSLIEKAGYSQPTPVQAATIPRALENHDLIVSAQTGTGKTASFVLPIVQKFAGRRGTFVLILAPTREIALQIYETLEIFAKPLGLTSAVLIGGISLDLDAKAIQNYPEIIVGTPGRICDHLERGNLWLDYLEMVVLDEADRMLSMGFSKQLNQITDILPASRQTMLFSATFLPSVESLAQRILKDPVRVSIGRTSSAQSLVEQKLIWVREDDKKKKLVRILQEEPGSIIIFTRSKDAAHRLWLYLHSQGIYDATYLTSDRAQSHREQALNDFKSGQHRILIATDVAGRGIHVDGVAHVVNFELPMDPEDYVHRVGRTGRAETKGKATSFATYRDRELLGEIERILGIPIPSEGTPERDYPRDSRSGGRSGPSGRSGSGGRPSSGGGGGSSSGNRPRRGPSSQGGKRGPTSGSGRGGSSSGGTPFGG